MLTQSLGPSPAKPRTAPTVPRRPWPWLDRAGRFSTLKAVLVAGCFAWLLLWRALPVRWQGNGLALLALAPLAALGAALLEYAWYTLATAIPAGRVLLANLDLGLDFGFSPRPAIWVGRAALGLTLAGMVWRLVTGLAGARA